MSKDKEKYKVVVRCKLSHAIMDESPIIEGYDSWIKACAKRDEMKETTDLEDFVVEIIEV